MTRRSVIGRIAGAFASLFAQPSDPSVYQEIYRTVRCTCGQGGGGGGVGSITVTIIGNLNENSREALARQLREEIART